MNLKKILDNIENYNSSDQLLFDLNKVDYSDHKNKLIAKKYISEILDYYIGNNKSIPVTIALSIHFLIAKLSLIKVGLNGIVGIVYRQRRNDEKATGAFYLEDDKTITVFTNDILNNREFLNPYSTNKNQSMASRLDYLVNLVFTLEHEIQHAVQFTRVDGKKDDLVSMAKSDYIIAMQRAARSLSKSLSGFKGSSYYSKDLDFDRLYKDNHDKFYYEIDADKYAYERTLDILYSISPLAYKVATDTNKYRDKLNRSDVSLNKYEEAICWTHNTNVNNVDVPAVHKTSMIIDNIMPLLDSANINRCFELFPVLKFTYNVDGTKKTLKQIEKERDEKIEELYSQRDQTNLHIRKNQILSLYNTIIDCDALLCYEKSKILLLDLQENGIKYYIEHGLIQKYSDEELGKAINVTEQKINSIESYLEEIDKEKLNSINEQYDFNTHSMKK